MFYLHILEGGMFMNNDFYEKIVDAVKQLLSDEYEVLESNTKKNNGVIKHGIAIHNKNTHISPVFYLDQYVGAAPEVVAQQIVENYTQVKEKEVPFDIDKLTDFNSMREQIGYRIVNKQYNEDMLADVPHNDIAGDLSIIYFVEINDEATITIRNGLLDIWGISGENLFEIASDNMQRLHPASFKSMAETMVDMMMRGSVKEMKAHFGVQELSDAEFKQMLVKQFEQDTPIDMYVLRGADNYGASVILYDDVMEEIRNKFGADFFIIPSSVHEVLVIKDDGFVNIADIKNIIAEVNSSEVSEVDKLSDNLYCYKNGQILIVDESFTQQRNADNHEIR